MIEDIRGEKFGYYLNSTVVEKYQQFVTVDKNCFHFNLKSNGRLSGPMKFEIKNFNNGGYKIYDKSMNHPSLITIGEIFIMRQGTTSYYNNCEQHENYFNYHGIERALCGLEPNHKGEMIFKPKKIIVIQMK